MNQKPADTRTDESGDDYDEKGFRVRRRILIRSSSFSSLERLQGPFPGWAVMVHEREAHQRLFRRSHHQRVVGRSTGLRLRFEGREHELHISIEFA
jgi:hypothetical protein